MAAALYNTENTKAYKTWTKAVKKGQNFTPYNTRHCFFFQFTEIMFLDHQTLAKVYFKRRTNQSITANLNYGNRASTYGLWDGVGVSDAFHYQLLICNTSFYSGFFVSGYRNCYKQCDDWCGDGVSPYFRTASSDSHYFGVAFNTTGHIPLVKRLISVGLR